MIDNKAPCLNCKDRVLGCHSTCERYKEFTEINERRKGEIRKDKEVNNIINGYNKAKASGLKTSTYRKKKTTF